MKNADEAKQGKAVAAIEAIEDLEVSILLLSLIFFSLESSL